MHNIQMLILNMTKKTSMIFNYILHILHALQIKFYAQYLQKICFFYSNNKTWLYNKQTCTLLVFEDTLKNIFSLQFTKATADMFMTYTILFFSRGFQKICTRVTISIHKLVALAPTSTMQRKNIQKPEAQNISNENLCQVEYYDVLT